VKIGQAKRGSTQTAATRRIRRLGLASLASLIVLLALGAGGCGVLRDTPPTVTPIFITATPPPPVIPIIATETPAATDVLPPTSAAMLPTHATTRTATPTRLPPITMTPTFTPTATDTPVTPGVVRYEPVGGVGAAGSAACANPAQGVFGAIIQNDPDIAGAIGCPLSGAASAVSSAYQSFQNGVMIWVASQGTQPQSAIYALYNDGTYQRFNDTWTEGEPQSGGATPPDGLLEPVRGFGKVWRDNPTARNTLGWATAPEAGGTAQIQLFERGVMMTVTQTSQTYILITGAPGTWTTRSGS
jgi:hypothetical protein